MNSFRSPIPSRQSISSLLGGLSHTSRSFSGRAKAKSMISGSSLPSLSSKPKPNVINTSRSQFNSVTINSKENLSQFIEPSPKTQKLINASTELQPTFGSLSNFVATVDNWTLLGEFPKENALHLLRVASKLLFRPLPFISLIALRSDSYYRPQVNNIKQILLAHRFLDSLITYLNPQFITRWLNEKTFHKIFNLLSSPDSNEQKLSEQHVQSIIQQFPNSKMSVLKYCRKFIIEVLMKNRLFIGLSYVLHIVETILLETPDFIALCDQLFINNILPLFNVEFMYDFYPNLAQVCSLFYNYDDSYVTKAAKYLLTHWPVCDSQKEVWFIVHLGSLSTIRGSQPIISLIDQIFTKIYYSLKSTSYKSVVAALHVVSDPKFVFDYVSYYTFDLLEAIRDTKNHWSYDVSSITDKTLNLIKETAPSLNVVPVSKPCVHESNVKDKWAKIAKLANVPISEEKLAEL